MENKLNSLKIVLIIFFGFSVLLPLLNIFSYIDLNSMEKFLNNALLKKAIVNSVFYSTVSTIISITLGFCFAYAILRTRIKYKQLFMALFTVPMLIPSISHGMGLIVIFGTNGFLANFFNWQESIYGPIGIIIGSLLYSFPVAFLMILDVLKYEDGSVYEAADVLGISRFKQIKDITVPFLVKPLIIVFFAVFTMIITDYGVPLIVGGKTITLPVLMYQEVAGLLNFSKGAIIGAVLLIPAIIAFVLDSSINNSKNSGKVITPINVVKNKVRDYFAYIGVVTGLVCLLAPILVFIPLSLVKKYPFNLEFTFNNIVNTFNLNGMNYLINSLTIALVVAIIGTIGAFVTAYLTVRVKSKLSMILHLSTIISLAIPGIVLGLAYILFFKGSLIYGTVAILIVVNTIHFFASPYLMIYNVFGKMNADIENTAFILGISRYKVIKDVIVPQVKGTLYEMFGYYFVNCMMTISAVVFLSNTSNKPIALLIPQFEGQMMLECAAFVSVIILVTNILMKSLIAFLKNRGEVRC